MSNIKKRSILEQQIKTKRLQAPHIRASDLQIVRSDGNKDGILAYNGNAIQLFIGNPLDFLLLRIFTESGGAHTYNMYIIVYHRRVLSFIYFFFVEIFIQKVHLFHDFLLFYFVYRHAYT